MAMRWIEMPLLPEYVRDMHTFYAEHGYYRPEDVLRVLGDQGVTVRSPKRPKPCAG